MNKLLKGLFYILIILGVFNIGNTYASYKVLILDYEKLSKNNIDDLEITTINNSIAKIKDDKNKKKYFLEILDKFNENNIEIVIKYNGKSFIHHYRYVPDYPENFDISGKMKLKRLQKKPLSCELSVTADILSYIKGINVSEDDVLSKITKSHYNKLPFLYENKIFWGNPNEGFVGYMDYYGEKKEIIPTQRNMTGYGVYERPIAGVYSKYGLSYSIISKSDYNSSLDSSIHLSFLLKNLLQGNMVQLWGDWCTREEYEDGTIEKKDITQEKVDKKISAKNYCESTMDDRKLEWYYIEDYKFKKHVGLIGEHAFYLLGYEGNIEKPNKILLWDSDTGYHKYDTIEWMRKWKLMDYKSIIINKL